MRNCPLQVRGLSRTYCKRTFGKWLLNQESLVITLCRYKESLIIPRKLSRKKGRFNLIENSQSHKLCPQLEEKRIKRLVY